MFLRPGHRPGAFATADAPFFGRRRRSTLQSVREVV